MHGIPVAVFPDVGGAIDLVRDRENGFILGDQSDLTALWRKLAAGPATRPDRQYRTLPHLIRSQFHGIGMKAVGKHGRFVRRAISR